MKKPAEDLTIGQKVYLIHREYVGRKMIGARILMAKVKTFHRCKEGIQPIFTEVGKSSREISFGTHIVYRTIEEAIKHL